MGSSVTYDRAALTRSIKRKAAALGFELVGVTTPDPLPHINIYQDWLSQGRHGEMAYLATERAVRRRQNPREILPECQSVLVLGIRHFAQPAEKSPETGNPRGRVAAYALGQDYHDALKPRLQALVVFIEQQAGQEIPNRWYTDTGPVLERDLAQRAGLGWIGKNTCLIHPRHGSYFLLAEILLGIDLVPDQGISEDFCGSCTRCIEACPTDCILPDRTIDSRQCISYLTIELKTEIPVELRDAMGDWVFGCDICQEVCPWNVRFAQPGGEEAFAPRPDVQRPELREEILMNQEAFSRKFKGSPVKRPKRAGYLRNVAVALGNSGDSSAIPELEQALASDPSPLVRSHAAWALGRLGGGRAAEALTKASGSETDVAVLEEIRLALAATEG